MELKDQRNLDQKFEKKTILLVEDDVIISMMETRTLITNGFNVITAKTGELAVEIAENNSDIDLILMDINLGPGIDGTEAAEKILHSHDIPLVFLSSHTEPEVVDKTEGITSYGYIVKSASETVLIASIKMAFRLFDARLKEKEKIYELERFHRITVNRELSMIDLKNEVNNLLSELHRPPKYKIINVSMPLTEMRKNDQ